MNLNLKQAGSRAPEEEVYGEYLGDDGNWRKNLEREGLPGNTYAIYHNFNFSPGSAKPFVYAHFIEPWTNACRQRAAAETVIEYNTEANTLAIKTTAGVTAVIMVEQNGHLVPVPVIAAPNKLTTLPSNTHSVVFYTNFQKRLIDEGAFHQALANSLETEGDTILAKDSVTISTTLGQTLNDKELWGIVRFPSNAQ